MRHRSAYLRIEPLQGGLADTAKTLGDTLGVEFEEDVDGRYEEFPAYLGRANHMQYALLGFADDSTEEDVALGFELKVFTDIKGGLLEVKEARKSGKKLQTLKDFLRKSNS